MADVVSSPVIATVGAAATAAGGRRDAAADGAIVARLERLPMTAYQRGLFVIIATAWLFDSIDLGSLTFVLGSIRTTFALSQAEAGLLSSMSFAGMFVGAAVAGIAADRFGRKPVFQLSMIVWGLGSLGCALAPDPATFGAARFVLGFGMGMEFPVALALMSELLPAADRGRYLAILEGFWPLGFIAAGLLSLVLLQAFDWRAVFLAQAVPAVFLFVIRLLVPESPRWLSARGRHADADRELSAIEAKVTGKLGGARLQAPLPLPVAEAAADPRFSFLELWRKDYATRTVMIWITWFFALLGFYGLTTWLGALLQDAGYSVARSVAYTLSISLAGIPGFIAAAILIERWGRKPTCVAMLLGSAVSAYLYGHAPSLPALIGFGLCMQFFLFGMWSVLYAYTPELYPTRARATGTGCASAVGRLGSLLGPALLGVVLPALGQGGVFAVGAGSFVIAALAVLALGVETRGSSLEALSH